MNNKTKSKLRLKKADRRLAYEYKRRHRERKMLQSVASDTDEKETRAEANYVKALKVYRWLAVCGGKYKRVVNKAQLPDISKAVVVADETTCCGRGCEEGGCCE